MHTVPIDPSQVESIVQGQYTTNYIDVALLALVVYNNCEFLPHYRMSVSIENVHSSDIRQRGAF